ncbi:hypothetical protein LY78DRAFT_214702 [Colletotrichum sublineola]|nr:hypothetical protein LY78DRAFT_214702 [Colletotrichum sublineola]
MDGQLQVRVEDIWYKKIAIRASHRQWRASTHGVKMLWAKFIIAEHVRWPCLNMNDSAGRGELLDLAAISQSVWYGSKAFLLRRDTMLPSPCCFRAPLGNTRLPLFESMYLTYLCTLPTRHVYPQQRPPLKSVFRLRSKSQKEEKGKKAQPLPPEFRFCSPLSQERMVLLVIDVHYPYMTGSY